MASLPLAGVKPCPRRRLIRAEEGRRGGAADTQKQGAWSKGPAATQREEGLD